MDQAAGSLLIPLPVNLGSAGVPDFSGVPVMVPLSALTSGSMLAMQPMASPPILYSPPLVANSAPQPEALQGQWTSPGEICTALQGQWVPVLQLPPAAWPGASGSGSGTGSLHAAEYSEFAVGHGGGALPSTVERVVGRVWSFAQDAKGCRVVQQAVEDAASDDDREALAVELRGFVWQAARCRHANYVLQKFVTAMKPQSSQFIIDEVMQKGPARLARHKYGCRTLQRLLEHCRSDQVAVLVDALFAQALVLCKHIYANFVMQHILEHGTPHQQHSLSIILRQHALAMGSDAHACAVVAKALSHGTLDDRIALARALLAQRGLIGQMAGTRYGHLAVKMLLQLLVGREKDEAHSQLVASISALRSCRYGQMALAGPARHEQ